MTPVGGSQGASTGITPALRRAAQCCDYSAMGSAMIDRKGKKIMYENTAFEKLYRQILAATKSVVGDDYSDDNHLLTILGRDEEKLKEMNEALDEKKPFECRSMIKAAQAGEVYFIVYDMFDYKQPFFFPVCTYEIYLLAHHTLLSRVKGRLRTTGSGSRSSSVSRQTVRRVNGLFLSTLTISRKRWFLRTSQRMPLTCSSPT